MSEKTLQPEGAEEYPTTYEVMREQQMKEKPNIKTLGELKEIFKSDFIVRIRLNGEDYDFKCKKADSLSLLQTQNSLFFLQDLAKKKNVSKETTTTDFLLSLPDNERESLLDKMLTDEQSRKELIIANVIEPTIDMELLDILPDEAVSILFEAITQNLKEGQYTLNLFRKTDTGSDE